MGWPTHDVTNQFDELQDYNLYATDHALQEAVTRHRGASAHDRLGDYGALMGTADSYAQADLRRRNGLLEGGQLKIPDRSYFQARQADAIQRMTERGIL